MWRLAEQICGYIGSKEMRSHFHFTAKFVRSGYIYLMCMRIKSLFKDKLLYYYDAAVNPDTLSRERSLSQTFLN